MTTPELRAAAVFSDKFRERITVTITTISASVRVLAACTGRGSAVMMCAGKGISVPGGRSGYCLTLSGNRRVMLAIEQTTLVGVFDYCDS